MPQLWYIIGCLLSMQHEGVKAKPGWLGIRIMCQSGATFLPANLFQWTSTIKIQLIVLIYYKADIIIISSKCNSFSPWYGWKIAHVTLNNNHSLTKAGFIWMKLSFKLLQTLNYLHGNDLSYFEITRFDYMLKLTCISIKFRNSKRLLHDIFHIGPGISPRLPYQAQQLEKIFELTNCENKSCICSTCKYFCFFLNE